MARISLLIFIAVVLTIGSVSAHPPKKTKKTLCPPTLSKLQTFPSHEISKLVQKKIKSAPNTPQFNTLFAICKAFSDYLAVPKGKAVKTIFTSVHAKYALMTEAMFSAQAAVGVEGKLAAQVRKSYNAMADGFVELEQMTAEISAKYKFNANAEISEADRLKIEKCVIKLKGCINVFVKVITKCSAKFAGKPVGNPVKPGGYLDDFIKKGVNFGGNFMGAIGGAFGGNAEAKVGGNAGAQGEVKVGGHAGGKVGGRKGKGRGKFGGLAGAQAGAKVGGNAEAKVGGQAGATTEVNVGGSAGGNAGGIFGGSFGFGGQVQYDAAGKAHVGGGSEFRPLSRAGNKHLD
ncbi:unnamed protein product [Eruca vesicaria subsp. sativa]|uniref:Uncharacterized protein n=1 Tax=Eruca vesicaria subsp. sativa TaxID=29727 RepID=A0ABC8LZP4_ERUVS|nr:unnamed protein product [Eruca vesicaria subsp. sativa]